MKNGDLMLDRILRIGLLYDYYSALLTDKQRKCLDMHYRHDLSLSEIADEFKVSRQAVYDILRRAEQILEDYETKLRLIERRHSEQQKLQQVYALLNGLSLPLRQLTNINLAISKLEGLLDCSKEL